MKESTLKASLKIASNILLFIALALMVLTVYLENFYLSIGTIALSVVSVCVSIFSADELDAKVIAKDLNLYFYLVCILISLSVTLSNQVLFYIGIVLFILMILLYLIPMFVAEKEEKGIAKKGQKSKKNKK